MKNEISPLFFRHCDMKLLTGFISAGNDCSWDIVIMPVTWTSIRLSMLKGLIDGVFVSEQEAAVDLESTMEFGGSDFFLRVYQAGRCSTNNQ